MSTEGKITSAISLIPEIWFQFSLGRLWHEIVHVFALMNHWSIILVEGLTWIGTVLILLTLSSNKFSGQADAARRKRVSRVLSLLILTGLVINTIVITIANHREDWRTAIDRAKYVSQTSFGLWNNSKRETPAIVVLGNGISSVVGQVDIFVRNRFPQLAISKISLHLLVQQDSPKGVWTLTREGQLESFSEYATSPNSLIGRVIESGTRKYCPDVSVQNSTDENCSDFDRPRGEVRYNYKSLICIPIQGSIGRAGNIAGLCFGSKKAHAFDGAGQVLEDSLQSQLADLGVLLEPYRAVFIDEMGKAHAHDN